MRSDFSISKVCPGRQSAEPVYFPDEEILSAVYALSGKENGREIIPDKS